jgi:cell division protein FtsL
MTPAEKYVAAAYLVVFAVLLVWVLIMSTKLVRLRGEVEKLGERRRAGDG